MVVPSFLQIRQQLKQQSAHANQYLIDTYFIKPHSDRICYKDYIYLFIAA